jgi:glutathione synthase/RimK-type ligase-like ATP-grasp enzyme
VDVVVFEADRVAKGEVEFTYTIREGRAWAEVGGRSFELESISAAWWRKPHWLWLDRNDALRAHSIEHEINRLQQMLWAPVRASAWLNAPEQIRAAGALSRQLIEASRVGLMAPETVVCNEWSRLSAFATNQAIAFKTLVGRVETANEPGRDVFTHRLTPTELHAPEVMSAAPYPGIAQPFIEKKREWRVTVVDEEVFAATIHTYGSAYVDWRRDYNTPRVCFSRGELPPNIALQCRAVTSRLGLRYAAIDLIESYNSEFVFLEANPNGQYLWLEEELDLPISQAIAAALVATAERAE